MKGKIIAVLVALATANVLAVTPSYWWHFNGEDGGLAPDTVTDKSGTYGLALYQFSETGKSYADQETQSDSAGCSAVWMQEGVLTQDEDVRGSVQLYRACAVEGYRRGAAYGLADSQQTKTLFPTNSQGEIKSFTFETCFKVDPKDATCEKQNFLLAMLTRGNDVKSDWTAVFRLTAISSGQLYLQCQSKVGGNGDLCSWPLLDQSSYADSQWHHLAMVYSLDESVSPHQGSVEIFFDYQSLGVKNLSSTTGDKVFDYAAWNSGATQKSMMNAGFSVGDMSGGSRKLCMDEVRVTQGVLTKDEFFVLVPESDFFFPLGIQGALGSNLVSRIGMTVSGVSETRFTPVQALSAAGRTLPCTVSAAFAGTSTVTVPSSATGTLFAGPFTLELAFKTANAGGATLVGQGDIWSLALEGGSLVWHHGEDSETVAGSLADNAWHALALTYSPNGVESGLFSVCVDGVRHPIADLVRPALKVNASLVYGTSFVGNMLGLRLTSSVLPMLSMQMVVDPSALGYWPFANTAASGTAVAGVWAADGNPQLTMTSGLVNHEESTEANRPVFTNEVPCKCVWDPVSGKVINPDNRSSVYFHNTAWWYQQGNCWVNGNGGGFLQTATGCNNFGKSYTIEFFVKPTHTYSQNMTAFLRNLMSDNSYVNIDAQFGYSLNAKLRFSNETEQNRHLGAITYALVAGEWRHVALTVDGDSDPDKVTITSYAGYEHGVTMTYDNKSFDVSKTCQLMIGFGDGKALDGIVDEVRFSRGALTPAGFMREFEPRADLTGVWLMDGASGAEHFNQGEFPYLDGTLTGAVASDALPFANAAFKVRGKGWIVPSKSVMFDGSGCLAVPCAAIAGADDFTVEATVRGIGTVAAKRRLGGVSWSFGIGADGKPTMHFDAGAYTGAGTESSVTATATVAVDTDGWHHLAMVCDRMAERTATLYVDGLPVATADISGMIIDGEDMVFGDGLVGNVVAARFSAQVLTADGFMVAGERPGSRLIIR